MEDMFSPKHMGTATRAVVILVGFSIKYRQIATHSAKAVTLVKEALPHDIVAHSEHNVHQTGHQTGDGTGKDQTHNGSPSGMLLPTPTLPSVWG